MDKRRSLKYFFISISIVMLISSFTLIGRAVLLEPGSADDPIVTLSYVKDEIDEIKNYLDQNLQQFSSEIINIHKNIGDINAKIEKLNPGASSGTSNIQSSGQTSFEVVFVEAGNFVYFGESAEFIVRSGKAITIEGEKGGLMDVTGGKDLKANEEIPLNHLVLIPRNDGRGASISVDSYLMVRGSYTIK